MSSIYIGDLASPGSMKHLGCRDVGSAGGRGMFHDKVQPFSAALRVSGTTKRLGLVHTRSPYECSGSFKGA